MPQKIIIVRHGETQYNVEHRLQGWADIPLNEQGLKQAELVAERLSQISVTAIYSSDQQRAHVTALSIGKKLALKPRKRRSLREDRMGIFEGWMWEKEPDPYKQKLWQERSLARQRGDLHWKVEGGESLLEHTNRVKRFIKRLESNHPQDSVILVSHGGTINRIMEIYGLKSQADEYIYYRNTSVTVLVKQGDKYVLELHNDTAHLI